MVNLTSVVWKRFKWLCEQAHRGCWWFNARQVFWGTVHAFRQKHLSYSRSRWRVTRLGGAANVANNIASLGGIPLLIGVVGKDIGARYIAKHRSWNGFPTDGMSLMNSRPTTVKTRLLRIANMLFDWSRRKRRSKGWNTGQSLSSLERQIFLWME